MPPQTNDLGFAMTSSFTTMVLNAMAVFNINNILYLLLFKVISMEKSITYFEKEGENYTDELISLVKQRLDESDEIRYILIASASGASALKLADAIEGDEQIINVSHHA